MSISRTIYLMLIAALVLTACDSDDEGVEAAESVVLLNQAAAVGNYVVLVDKESDRVISVDVSAKEEKLASKVKITENIAPNPIWIEAREGDSEEVLILSTGRRGVSQQAKLSAMKFGENVKVIAYEIEAPFDELLQSSDGDYAVLYFSEDADDLVYSLNEIAIVDLDNDDEKKAVVRQTIDTANGVIDFIDISPVMKIGKQKKTVAIALSESRATIVDLDNPKRKHTIVTLGGDADAQPILPEQVEFGEGEREVNEVYIRALNSNDIFVLSLEPAKDNFYTEVSQVPVGLAPSDMAVYEDGDATKILVVSKDSNDVHIVSRSSSDEDEDLTAGVLPQTVTIELEADAEEIALFKVAVSKKNKKNVALLYKKGSTTITLLDLDDAEKYKEQNLETITLREPVLSVEEFEGDDLALITHQSSQIDVLDLVSGDGVRTIQINDSLQNAVFDTARPRFWMVPPNKYFISYIDLHTGITNPDAVLLDDPIAQFVVVDEAEKVVAVHEHKVCDDEADEDEDTKDETTDEDDEEECSDEPISISIMDYDEPNRKDMIVFSDFF